MTIDEDTTTQDPVTHVRRDATGKVVPEVYSHDYTISDFGHANRLCTSLSCARAIGSRSPSSHRYHRPIINDEPGRIELARRIQGLIDGDPSGLNGDTQFRALAEYSARVLRRPVTP